MIQLYRGYYTSGKHIWQKKSRKSTDFTQLQFRVSGHRPESSAAPILCAVLPWVEGWQDTCLMWAVPLFADHLDKSQNSEPRQRGQLAAKPCWGRDLLTSRDFLGTQQIVTWPYHLPTELFTDKRLSLCHPPSSPLTQTLFETRYFQSIKLPSRLCSQPIIASSFFSCT